MNSRIIYLPSTLLATAAAALLFSAVAPPAHADRDDDRSPKAPVTGTVELKTGVTSVVLAETFQTALTSLGVEMRKVIPGQIVKGRRTLRFPIRGGAFDLDTLQGEFIHGGGITLKTATATVSLTDFVISLPGLDPVPEPSTDTTLVSSELLPVAAGPLADLSALVVVNGDLIGRVSLFAVDVSASGLVAPHVLAKHRKLSIPNVGLSLTLEGADALNAALGVTSFVAGDAVGTASILASTGRCDD